LICGPKWEVVVLKTASGPNEEIESKEIFQTIQKGRFFFPRLLRISYDAVEAYGGAGERFFQLMVHGVVVGCVTIKKGGDIFPEFRL